MNKGATTLFEKSKEFAQAQRAQNTPQVKSSPTPQKPALSPEESRDTLQTLHDALAENLIRSQHSDSMSQMTIPLIPIAGATLLQQGLNYVRNIDKRQHMKEAKEALKALQTDIEALSSQPAQAHGNDEPIDPEKALSHYREAEIAVQKVAGSERHQKILDANIGALGAGVLGGASLMGATYLSGGLALQIYGLSLTTAPGVSVFAGGAALGGWNMVAFKQLAEETSHMAFGTQGQTANMKERYFRDMETVASVAVSAHIGQAMSAYSPLLRYSKPSAKHIDVAIKSLKTSFFTSVVDGSLAYTSNRLGGNDHDNAADYAKKRFLTSAALNTPLSYGLAYSQIVNTQRTANKTLIDDVEKYISSRPVNMVDENGKLVPEIFKNPDIVAWRQEGRHVDLALGLPRSNDPFDSANLRLTFKPLAEDPYSSVPTYKIPDLPSTSAQAPVIQGMREQSGLLSFIHQNYQSLPEAVRQTSQGINRLSLAGLKASGVQIEIDTISVKLLDGSVVPSEYIRLGSQFDTGGPTLISPGVRDAIATHVHPSSRPHLSPTDISVLKRQADMNFERADIPDFQSLGLVSIDQNDVIVGRVYHRDGLHDNILMAPDGASIPSGIQYGNEFVWLKDIDTTWGQNAHTWHISPLQGLKDYTSFTTRQMSQIPIVSTASQILKIAVPLSLASLAKNYLNKRDNDDAENGTKTHEP
jgi:hypothetical protein